MTGGNSVTVRSLLRLHDAKKKPRRSQLPPGLPAGSGVLLEKTSPPTLSGTMLHYCDVRVRNPQAKEAAMNKLMITMVLVIAFSLSALAAGSKTKT